MDNAEAIAFANTPIGNTGKVAPLSHIKTVYDVAGDIVDALDMYGMRELTSGTSNDIDKLFRVISEETYKAIFTPEAVSFGQTYNYLDSFVATFENTLRKSVFNYFTLTVLPKFELAPHIIEWGNLIQVFASLGFIAARGHAKSYTCSYAYPLWKLWRYADKFMGEKSFEYSMSKEGMIITNEIGLAKHFLGKIKDEIESNDILREVLYNHTRDGWGGERIECKNGSTLIVKSYGSRMRGYHPTWIVVDDLLMENVLYSAEQKTKYNTFFHTVIYNMLVKGGQIVVVGTPFCAGDLYDDLKIRQEWEMFEFPAIFPDGTILWESEHNFKSLMALKEKIGSVNFSREILVRPISDASSVFPYERIKESYAGMHRYTLVNNIEAHPMKDSFTRIVVGMDFALSADAAADFSVFIVLAQDTAGRYWLIHLFRGKGLPYDRQIAEAKRINRDFRPDIFVVETNQAQKIFAQMMIDEGMPVLEHNTGVEKHSLYEGIPAMAVLFEQGTFRLPRGDQYSRDATDLLASQLTSFTYDADKGKLVFVLEHDDDAMALWQGCRGMKYAGGKFGFNFI